MQLIAIYRSDLDRAYAMFSLLPRDDHGFINPAYGMSRAEFEHLVQRLEDYSKGVNLPEGYVPCNTFIIANDAEEYVGVINVRYDHEERLKNSVGHIGYGIAPQHRRKGYATGALKLALADAKAHGLHRVVMSAHVENLASQAVQRSCGATVIERNSDHVFSVITLD